MKSGLDRILAATDIGAIRRGVLGVRFFVKPKLEKVITVRISAEDLAALDRLKAASGARSYSEVVRDALGIYYYFIDVLENGYQIKVEKKHAEGSSLDSTGAPHADTVTSPQMVTSTVISGLAFTVGGPCF